MARQPSAATKPVQPLWTHPIARPLPFPKDAPWAFDGPFLHMGGQKLLTSFTGGILRSSDNGQTWTAQPLFEPKPRAKNYNVAAERVMLKTADGSILLSFINLNEMVWGWRDELKDILPGTRCPHYVMRSVDAGKTWQDVTMLHEHWTGDVRTIIQTRRGRLVLSSMRMLTNPGRHTVLTYTSSDDGVTWAPSNIIDLGGAGHHGGVTEATLIETLVDDHLIMLLRTNWGEFWRADSFDAGQSWRTIRPSGIPASSAPGQLTRLASGRLLLFWNRRFPDGKSTWPTTGGDGLWSEVPVSNFREELSVAWSDDDAASWSSPLVIARKKEGWLSYPRVLERKPGLIWLTTMQGNLRIEFNEKDLLAATPS